MLNQIRKKKIQIKRHYNAKVTEFEGEVPTITGLAFTTPLNAVEDKIPNVNNMV